MFEYGKPPAFAKRKAIGSSTANQPIIMKMMMIMMMIVMVRIMIKMQLEIILMILGGKYIINLGETSIILLMMMIF